MQPNNMEYILRIRIPRKMYNDCLHLAENNAIPMSTYARYLLNKALYGNEAKEEFEKVKNRKKKK